MFAKRKALSVAPRIVRTVSLLLAPLLWVGTASIAADTPPQHRYHACMAFARVQPENALSEAERWSDTGGGDAAAHCIATALFGLGRHAEAAQRFEALAARTGDIDLRAALFAQAARAWLQAGEPARAIAQSDRALSIMPGDSQFLIDRAEARAASADYEGAARDLTLAIANEPGLADAHVFRASAYRRMGRLEAAREDLDLVLQGDPDHAEARLERGLIRRLQRDEAGARADWQTILRNHPDTPAAEAAHMHLEAKPASARP